MPGFVREVIPKVFGEGTSDPWRGGAVQVGVNVGVWPLVICYITMEHVPFVDGLPEIGEIQCVQLLEDSP